jgi:transglutaminase-like putative cysteine protease
VDLAHKAVGDAKDAAQAARRIESFVARYIDNKSMSVGYASAAEVVESRQGDCSEFAVLTAALCRAVGIPAMPGLT